MQAPFSLDAEVGNALSAMFKRDRHSPDDARREGQVQIKRRDGQTFEIKPVEEEKSPLGIAGVSKDLSLEELNGAVRESRERL